MLSDSGLSTICSATTAHNIKAVRVGQYSLQNYNRKTNKRPRVMLNKLLPPPRFTVEMVLSRWAVCEQNKWLQVPATVKNPTRLCIIHSYRCNIHKEATRCFFTDRQAKGRVYKHNIHLCLCAVWVLPISPVLLSVDSDFFVGLRPRPPWRIPIGPWKNRRHQQNCVSVIMWRNARVHVCVCNLMVMVVVVDQMSAVH